MREQIPAAEPPVVRLRGLTRSFGPSPVLNGLDLDIRPGEFVALLGRSGSGKTTLLRALGDLDQDYSGELSAPTARAIAFQEARLLPWKRVWENVALGLKGAAPRHRAEAALREVGLAHRLDAWPATLSGGEGQRVALARALVREPDLLLLDEPFAALDALTRMRAHGLVEALWKEHRPAVLLVTHDVDEALLLADRALVLEAGRITLDLPIGLERPRRTDLQAFQELRWELLKALGVELAPASPARSEPGNVHLRLIDPDVATA
ncbi:ABC transporter ATP-binding protein [Sandaracinobacter sp. RS1-74]|uniref:ABC transporter ATP-binding protein n=1 Tax=Sandaracinobacteroides sayramensis TaxID=2913411 RepID=UPI001EDC5779|nr:ABC transporter ATP-binding protein [Sandaracinobacteroides sayramensis]MCG2842449.1 ABC transporter ATP-binding protein [Sandaracinobacteroides sayramensis]